MPFIFTVVSLINSDAFSCNPWFDKITSKVTFVSPPFLVTRKRPVQETIQELQAFQSNSWRITAKASHSQTTQHDPGPLCCVSLS